MIWVALAIVVAALIVRHELRRLTRVFAGFSMVIARMANRTAERNGEAPFITKDDVDRLNDILP